MDPTQLGLPDITLANEPLTPTIDVPALDTAVLNNDNLPAVAPASNQNQSAGTTLDQLTAALTAMVDGGAAVYNHVAVLTGTKQIGTAATTVPTVAQRNVLGLTQQQFLIVGGGILAIALLLIVRRR